MVGATYLVFGDLHGRVLPAFRLALAWQRDHGERLAGLFQVGDLGFFPDPARLDKATRRHAERDPLELGATLVACPSREADAVFAELGLPEALWFTAGNHEDFEALEALKQGAGSTRDDFPVDSYGRVRCVRDGHVLRLPGRPRLAALWGIDEEAPNARRGHAPRAYLNLRAAMQLLTGGFDVLLAHESPRDVVRPGSGSEAITSVLRHARPAFAFFGHYHTDGPLEAAGLAPTQVYHLGPDWLRTVTRHNWKHR
jgi:hypothetical protein